jgi:hypothetical protein
MHNPNTPVSWAEAVCFSEALYTMINATQDFIFGLAFISIFAIIIQYKLLK